MGSVTHFLIFGWVHLGTRRRERERKKTEVFTTKTSFNPYYGFRSKWCIQGSFHWSKLVLLYGLTWFGIFFFCSVWALDLYSSVLINNTYTWVWKGLKFGISGLACLLPISLVFLNFSFGGLVNLGFEWIGRSTCRVWSHSEFVIYFGWPM